MNVAARLGALVVLLSLIDGCASWGRPIGIPLRNKTQFASEWKKYQDMPGFKALAVAGNLGGIYVSGWTSEYCEQQKATANALLRCEERRRDRRIDEPCRIYAVGNEIWVPAE